MVYVSDKNGEPLMPTTRYGHIRILLKERKAVVVKERPFTVKLLYDVDEAGNEKIILGMDPGRTNIGLCAVTEDGVSLISANAVTRNKKIPKLMSDRREYRTKHRHLKRRCVRQRRAKSAGTTGMPVIRRKLPKCDVDIECHDIKNKEVRFCNRKRPEGWLTPTARQLLETHINLIKTMMKILPVSDVVIELNRFNFMTMDNPNIKSWQYQKGPLYKKGSVNDAVYEAQEGKCLLCDNDIDHYHHVVPKSKGGSNTIDNIVGLCKDCHHKVHTTKEAFLDLQKKKNGLNKKYGALSVLNQIIPYLIDELSDMFPGHIYVTDGKSTKAFRDDHNIEKDHYLDAYCIACSILDIKKADPPEDSFTIYQYRRHDRMACHKENVDRKYYKDGKLVATNRHKRAEQKPDSLDEYRKTHSQAYISELTVKEHSPQYKDMSRIMPGALMRDTATSRLFVMNNSEGRHNGKVDYYISTDMSKHWASRCQSVRYNTGLVFI